RKHEINSIPGCPSKSRQTATSTVQNSSTPLHFSETKGKNTYLGFPFWASSLAKYTSVHSFSSRNAGVFFSLADNRISFDRNRGNSAGSSLPPACLPGSTVRRFVRLAVSGFASGSSAIRPGGRVWPDLPVAFARAREPFRKHGLSVRPNKPLSHIVPTSLGG